VNKDAIYVWKIFWANEAKGDRNVEEEGEA
jgi:hypothetical protein